MNQRKQILDGIGKAEQRILGESPEEIRGLTFKQFLRKHVVCDGGVKYSFKNHEPWEHIVDRMSEIPELVVTKGTQVTATTTFLAYCAYRAARSGVDVGYCIPTAAESKKFYDRFDRIRDDSALLSKMITGKRSDSAFTINRQFMRMIGLWDLSDAISDPYGLICEDEVDFLNAAARSWIQERLDHARDPQRIMFCRGTMPGIGIDMEYQKSDRSKWMVRGSCGHEWNPEDTFPDCISEKRGEYPTFICPKCGSSVDIIKQGKWFPENPLMTTDREGFRVSQLIIRAVNLQRIMRTYHAITTKREFRAFSGRVLAKPLGGELGGITDDHLRGCQVDYNFVQASSWSVCGIDQGDWCHVVFLVPGMGRRLRVGLALRISTDRIEEVLPPIMRAMNVQCTVCDAKPERAAPRRLSKQFSHFYPHDYNSSGDKIVEREFDGRVYKYMETEREGSLQLFEELFDENNPQIEIPQHINNIDTIESDFGRQLKEGSLKEKVETRRGEDVKYFSGGNSHYFHAGSYAYTAWRFLNRSTGFGLGVQPVCSTLRPGVSR